MAIPSPEVVVSFFSNAAQIFGLLTLAVGGAFFSRRRIARRGRGRSATTAGGIATRNVLAVLVALFAVSAVVNVLQWSWSADARIERLSANLLRASTEAGKRVGDTSLKTLALSEQVQHPLGISTDELARLRQAQDSSGGANGPVNFIDVREDEEWETGKLSGFKHTRYPDVLARVEALHIKDKTNVLLCHSGNRSSELCDALAAKGIDCRFVIGGYEKWVAEGRSILRKDGVASHELRGIPRFPNDDALLDTPEVRRLAEEEGAVFVDVRYPEDFEKGHLPGALNIPVRKMTSEELTAGLGKVPAKPVVAPCYDKRSCFYAKILGLRLSRMGHDFRGRYTVPHEYLPTAARKPYVESWLAANHDGLLGQALLPVVAFLKWMGGKLGNLILAIFLAVAMLRLALLPFTVKSERDQIVQRHVDERIRQLKRDHANDPRGLKSAIHRVYRSNRLTPGRNIIGLIVQILCLVVLFSAVSAVATDGSGRFLWVDNIGLPDPFYALPALLAVLVYLQVEIGAVRRSARMIALRVLAGAAFGFITFQLKAALLLYLIFGLLLMLVQGLAIRVAMARASEAKKPLPPQISPLAVAHRVPGAGRKAHRLGELIAAGIPVPNGLVIPHGAFLKGSRSTQLDPKSQKRLARLRRRLRLRRMAVRSSGASEDGGDHSYAGVFDSLLNVDVGGLTEAIAQVRRSFEDGAAAGYGNGDSSGGVIVQAMVDAEYAGILFTEHPSQCGTLLVEMTEGLADDLASGTEEPNSFAFGRFTGRPNDGPEPPIDLAPLIELAMQIECLFGHPQDVEWAYRRGRFYILQARDITVFERLGDAMTPTAIFERERFRLLEVARECGADEPALAQNELSELLPKPTPLSLSFMEELWKPGGSVDLACDSLGVPYEASPESNPMVVSVFGSLYVNMSEQRRRIRKGIGPFAAFRLSRAAESIERDFRENFLPDYMSELRLLEAMDFRKVPTSDLIGLLEDTTDRYFHDSHVQVDTINIAADFYVKAAERAMSRRGMNSGAVLGQGAASVMHRAMDVLRQLRHGEATAEEFLSVFGHRSPVDYELSLPRYREDMTMMESLIRSAAMSDSVPHTAKAAAEVPEDPTLALLIMRAHRFQALKEEAKHYSLREFAVVRRMFVELDRRTALDGGIFYLEFDEIGELRSGGRLEELKQRIAKRRGEAEFFADMRPLETSLTLRDLETLGASEADAADRSDETGAMQGSLVAGSSVVTGHARVLTGQDISAVRDGEIVVARYMHPSWTPAFPRLQGIVTEVGGWLSHTSILAREYDITTIIGVRAAEFRIQTGDMLRLNLDGSVDILERAAPEAGSDGDADDGGAPLAGVANSDSAVGEMAQSTSG